MYVILAYLSNKIMALVFIPSPSAGSNVEVSKFIYSTVSTGKPAESKGQRVGWSGVGHWVT